MFELSKKEVYIRDKVRELTHYMRKFQLVKYFSSKYPNISKYKWEKMKVSNLRGKYKQEMREYVESKMCV